MQTRAVSTQPPMQGCRTVTSGLRHLARTLSPWTVEPGPMVLPRDAGSSGADFDIGCFHQYPNDLTGFGESSGAFSDWCWVTTRLPTSRESRLTIEFKIEPLASAWWQTRCFGSPTPNPRSRPRSSVVPHIERRLAVWKMPLLRAAVL